MRSFFTKKKNTDIIVCLEALVVFALASLAVHDTNTATGAGYSLFIETGVLSRETWNILVDLVLLVLMIALPLIPKAVLKADLGSTALFFLGASAFSVYLRPDRFLAPFTGCSVLGIEDRKWAVIAYMPSWMICAGILLLVCSLRKEAMRKVISVCTLASVSCVLAGLFTPAFEIFIFASGYFVTMPFICIVSEDETNADPLTFRLIPGTVMFLCGVWRLIMVLSTYHM